MKIPCPRKQTTGCFTKARQDPVHFGEGNKEVHKEIQEEPSWTP